MTYSKLYFIFKILAIGLVWPLTTSSAFSGIYSSAHIGSGQRVITNSTTAKELYGASLGYDFPLLVPLKVEAFYKHNQLHYFGIGGRLTVIPLFNINGGAFKRFSKIKTEKSKTGIYGGAGINFNWLPVIDIIADINDYYLPGEHNLTIEFGLRIHL